MCALLSQKITVFATGNYSVSVTDKSGCLATTNYQVSPPPMELQIKTDYPYICPEESIELEASTLVSAFSYQWASGETTPIIAVSSPGQYSVEVTDANGCNQQASIVIQTGTLTTAEIVTAGSLCGEDPVTLSVLSEDQDLMYEWSNPSVSLEKDAIVHQSGNYHVTVTNTFGCKTTLEEEVIKYPYPTGYLLTVDNHNICPSGSPQQLLANSLRSVSACPADPSCATEAHPIVSGIHPNTLVAWSTGEFGPTTVVDKPGVITVQISEQYKTTVGAVGCIATEELFIKSCAGCDKALCDYRTDTEDNRYVYEITLHGNDLKCAYFSEPAYDQFITQIDDAASHYLVSNIGISGDIGIANADIAGPFIPCPPESKKISGQELKITVDIRVTAGSFIFDWDVEIVEGLKKCVASLELYPIEIDFRGVKSIHRLRKGTYSATFDREQTGNLDPILLSIADGIKGFLQSCQTAPRIDLSEFTCLEEFPGPAPTQAALESSISEFLNATGTSAKVFITSSQNINPEFNLEDAFYLVRDQFENQNYPSNYAIWLHHDAENNRLCYRHEYKEGAIDLSEKFPSTENLEYQIAISDAAVDELFSEPLDVKNTFSVKPFIRQLQMIAAMKSYMLISMQEGHIPPFFWDSHTNPTFHNAIWIHIPPISAGIVDGVLNEVVGVADFLELAGQCFKKEVRASIWRSISSINQKTIEDFAIKAVASKIEIYQSNNPDIVQHEVGTDIVVVAEMISGFASLSKGVKAIKAMNKATDILGGFLKNSDECQIRKYTM